MITYYLWIKAFHIIAVIAWISALLYLPRLFVYHAATTSQEVMQTLEVMERRLHLIIMTPAMLASLFFGIVMIVLNPSLLTQPWFHVKLTLAVLLIFIHHMFAIWRKAFLRQQNRHSEKFYRIVNEVPTIVMILIVIFVIVKPSWVL